jgi:hypothetical protein
VTAYPPAPLPPPLLPAACSVNMQDTLAAAFESDDEGGDGGDEPNDITFNVSVAKGPKALVFECTSDGTYVDIRHVSFEPASGVESETSYTGGWVGWGAVLCGVGLVDGGLRWDVGDRSSRLWHHECRRLGGNCGCSCVVFGLAGPGAVRDLMALSNVTACIVMWPPILMQRMCQHTPHVCLHAPLPPPFSPRPCVW